MLRKLICSSNSTNHRATASDRYHSLSMIQLQPLLFLLLTVQSCQAIRLLVWGHAAPQRQPPPPSPSLALSPEQRSTYILPILCSYWLYLNSAMLPPPVDAFQQLSGDKPNPLFKDRDLIDSLSIIRQGDCHREAVANLQLRCRVEHGLNADVRFASELLCFHPSERRARRWTDHFATRII